MTRRTAGATDDGGAGYISAAVLVPSLQSKISRTLFIVHDRVVLEHIKARELNHTEAHQHPHKEEERLEAIDDLNQFVLLSSVSRKNLGRKVYFVGGPGRLP